MPIPNPLPHTSGVTGAPSVPPAGENPQAPFVQTETKTKGVVGRVFSTGGMARGCWPPNPSRR